MSRSRTRRVEHLKQFLIGQLREQVYGPGDKFPSARLIVVDHNISYQTAHRLLEELSNEGYLERRPGSGTYVPGGVGAPTSSVREVRLIMSQRARRPNSFGARLLAGLAEQLRRMGLSWQLEWAEAATDLADSLGGDIYPVLWEAPVALELCRRTARRALVLNDRPSPGLEATLLDSVSLDDYFGGCCAAELLKNKRPGNASFAVVSGPDDPRSNDRLAGFLSILPGAAVVSAGGWYIENGLSIAREALTAGKDGIFCVNDRLAEAMLTFANGHGYRRPSLVGFDNAPVAATLNLTTIAIPWGELTGDAARIIERRVNRDTTAARRQLVTPQPILREL